MTDPHQGPARPRRADGAGPQHRRKVCLGTPHLPTRVDARRAIRPQPAHPGPLSCADICAPTPVVCRPQSYRPRASCRICPSRSGYGSDARSQEWQGSLQSRRNGKLTAVPADPGRALPTASILTLRDGQPCEAAALLSAQTEFFIPEHAQSPYPLAPGDELWAEVTVPPAGPPRPIRLAHLGRQTVSRPQSCVAARPFLTASPQLCQHR